MPWLSHHKKAFSVASSMPIESRQEARTQIGLLVETGAAWNEAKEALFQVIGRFHPRCLGQDFSHRVQ